MSEGRNAIVCLAELCRAVVNSLKYLFDGWRYKQLKKRVKILGLLIFRYSHKLSEHLLKHDIGYTNIEGPEIKKLKKLTAGLHAQLGKDGVFTYSILIPVYCPPPTFLAKAVSSALEQTSPHYEVLIGFDGLQPPAVYETIEQLKQLYPETLKVFQIDRSETGGGISATTNYLAERAKGRFFLLVDHDDWIRPDLLFRYEQTLRFLPEPDKTVLYCNEYNIDEQDNVIAGSMCYKPERPSFPYFFINVVCHCLLIPAKLWKEVGGLRLECSGGQDYDLILRLDLIGAHFQNVPFFLYAWRAHSQSTAKDIFQKKEAIETPLIAWKNYCEKKNLNWTIEHGPIPTSYRAIPALLKTPSIHAIMLFKDQKEHTLKAVKSLLSQKNVKMKITAVDNNSCDLSIAETLRQQGVEILSIPEAFNFSRLNNLAVSQSQIGEQDDALLIVNNDVELYEDAVEEMARWLDQPSVGIVGCLLHYPNGRLQHGGIELVETEPTYKMTWKHTSKGKFYKDQDITSIIRVVDAVTGACVLIKRKTFLKVGGFDEVWYPIAFSDTHLCVKLRRENLFALYTPYAMGVHHESISRGLENIEDYENSRWLHHHLTLKN